MFERYQRRANSLPGMMIAADDITTDQGRNPGNGYQRIANMGPTMMAESDDPNVPYAPVEVLRHDWQQMANSGPQRIMRSDNVQLGRIGRRSGSMMRSVRGLGDGEGGNTTTPTSLICADFQPSKMLGPVIGYMLDQTAAGTFNVNDLTNVFGAKNVACTDTWLTDARQFCPTGSNQADIQICAIATVTSAIGADPVRLQNAAARMREHGWWNSSNWHFYWCYLSGSTPAYKNPLALAAVGLAGVTGYYGWKKKWFRK